MYKNKKYNILIVEDEFLNAVFVENIILDLGHIVVANVKSGNEALDIAKNNQVDFVFMDINLEGAMDGLQCAVLLSKNKDISIIYMTAFGDRKILQEAIDTNVYGYITKPFTQYNIESTLAIAIKIVEDKRYNSRNINLGEGYLYNIETQSLMFNNSPTVFSKILTEILYILALNIDQTISYKTLSDYVWKDRNISISTIRDTILRLRHQVPSLDIQNISGVGYSLKSK